MAENAINRKSKLPMIFTLAGENFAATNVRLEDAEKFCKRLGDFDGSAYRLPTEEEWEYACRGGTQTAYHFGDSEADLSEYAWWGGFKNGSAKNQKWANLVGQKKPNQFGLFDMHGNVAEICSKNNHARSTKARDNGKT